MRTKIHYIVIALLLVIGVSVAWMEQHSDESAGETPVVETPQGEQNTNGDAVNRQVPPTETPDSVGQEGESGTFRGVLEKVDVGCFADGECFVEVDGKHVTAIMGWTQGVVGSVQGVDGFGDLESHIGEVVEVYAELQDDHTYTLYGNSAYYIKRIEGASTAPVTTPGKGCVIGGCSGQLCTDASLGDMASTCEYREEYACYQTATCERQATGKCGWTETQALTQCLNTKSGGPERLEVQ